MGKSRYIKDDKGVTMSVATSTLGLEKPLLNENYNIDVHNRNMDKIDEDLTPIDDSYIIELFQHDGDTTNPRDYYTKVEADEKFATKEEVENIDLSNLATKEEANNALNKANEAFQRGDNVKTQLVDRLISEGLEVSTNNTFEELIENISLGKKWATGTANITSIGNNHYYRVHGLSFTPSVILTRTTNKTSVFHGYYISNLLQGKSRAIRGETDSDTNLYMRLFDVDTTSDTLTDAYCYNGNFSIKMYGSTGAYSSYIFDWIAFE